MGFYYYYEVISWTLLVQVSESLPIKNHAESAQITGKVTVQIRLRVGQQPVGRVAHILIPVTDMLLTYYHRWQK